MDAPIIKAITSVREVIIIAEPACPNINAILFSNGLFRFNFCACTSFQDAIIKKLSSTPRANNKKGKEVCTGPYEIPRREHTLIETIKAPPTHKRPTIVR